VGRQATAREGRERVEDQQHAGRADAEEHVPVGVAAEQLETEDVRVEPLGGVEVGGVDGRLDDGLDRGNGERRGRHGCDLPAERGILP
jgi:hypothetical protein